MADLRIAPDERRRIDDILDELAVVAADFFAEDEERLSEEEMTFLLGYATARMRAVLEVGTSLHALVAANEAGGVPYPGRGRDAFVAAALKAWKDCFAPSAEPWRLALLFDRLEGGERRVMADLTTLETMAANRLFTCLDEQCLRLLAAGDG